MDSKEKVKQKSTKSRLQKRVRILAVITSLSVIITFTTIITSIVICLYYKKQSSELEVFAEETAEDQNGEDEEAVEAVSGGIVYTQEEVDSMVTAAVTNAIDNADSELLQILQSRLENGDGTMTILRDLYPEHVVMLDSGQYYFLPLQEDLAMNTYIDENFIAEENGMVSYQEDGEVLTRKGIDVSKYQGEIDWEAVKNDGIDYAIIRVGIRGYSEGGILEDEFFRQNIEGAIANGIPVGVYFFTQAVNEAEALEEADFVIGMLQGYELTYPVYLDIEDVKKESCRTNGLTVEERTNNAKVFLERIREAGYEPALYGNMKSFLLMVDLASLEQYDKWFAGYTLPIYYPYEYKMLQYSEKGKVAGIPAAVDINICFKDYENAVQ
ncbi:MAG: hypothetical protein HFI11_03055 [Lachnospiraceae bacterium]|nr:hypothetical protein [Lachnospiraceae bacterium]